jgi:hypothetical protein
MCLPSRRELGTTGDEHRSSSGHGRRRCGCGTICYDAFKAICTAHNFPPDFPSPQVASGLLSMMLAHPGFYSVVAEDEGQIIGSNFLDERSCIAGLGPMCC